MAYEVGSSHQEVRNYLNDRMAWMGDALEVVGVGRDADPLQVFPEAAEVRAKSPTLTGLDGRQQAQLRVIAGRFGIGAEEDVKSEAQTQLNDGGKVWKVQAEAAITDGARRIIFSGTPRRIIDAEERAHMTDVMGWSVKPEATEFDMIGQVAASLPNFKPLDIPKVQPYGYDLSPAATTFVEAPKGQFMKVGKSDEAEVFTLRLDRLDYKNEEDQDKWKQPSSAEQMQFISQVLTASAVELTTIGFNSSNTYPSRAIDAVRASLQLGAVCMPGMYGRKTLAKVLRQPVVEPPELNQITGELHVVYNKLVLLEKDLNESI